MRSFIKITATLAVAATLAACGAPEPDPVVVQPTVPVEPVSGKF